MDPCQQNRVNWQRAFISSLAMAAVYLAGSPAKASSTIVSADFGSPYVAGLPLQGQPTNPPVWKTTFGGASSATVKSGVGIGNSPGVEVTRNAVANGDQHWAIPVTGYPTQRYAIVDWDMKVSQATVPGSFGPFMGVDIFDDKGPVYLLGTLGVDASTGDVLYQFQDTGFITETGLVVNFNQWYHYRIVLDFGSDIYLGYVNGNQVVSTGFVDRGFGLDNFTDANIATFAVGEGNLQLMSATAVFDNFMIRDGLLGDYNNDGSVNTSDWTTWRSSYGNVITPAGNLADGNRNGLVDAADYIIWRDNRGASISSGAGIGANLVPEPAGGSVVISSVLLAIATRRYRHCRGKCISSRMT